MSSDEFNVDDAIRHVCTVLGYSPDRACLEIAHRAAEGKLRAFGSRGGPPYLAPVGGGDWLIEEIPAPAWGENISVGWVREGLPWRGGEPYWLDHFVRSEFLALFSLAAAAKMKAPTKATTTSETPVKKFGRPLKYSWARAGGHLGNYVVANDPGHAEAVAELERWFEERREVPDRSELEDFVSEFFEENRK